jgi:hypothetical protein
MPSHWQFGHLQPKLWAKEGPGVKLPVWLPTTKSRESMPSRHPIWACDMALERSRRGLQLRFRPRRDPSWQSRVMTVQSSGSPVGTISKFDCSIGSVWTNSLELVVHLWWEHWRVGLQTSNPLQTLFYNLNLGRLHVVVMFTKTLQKCVADYDKMCHNHIFFQFMDA